MKYRILQQGMLVMSWLTKFQSLFGTNWEEFWAKKNPYPFSRTGIFKLLKKTIISFS